MSLELYRKYFDLQVEFKTGTKHERKLYETSKTSSNLTTELNITVMTAASENLFDSQYWVVQHCAVERETPVSDCDYYHMFYDCNPGRQLIMRAVNVNGGVVRLLIDVAHSEGNDDLEEWKRQRARFQSLREMLTNGDNMPIVLHIPRGFDAVFEMEQESWYLAVVRDMSKLAVCSPGALAHSVLLSIVGAGEEEMEFHRQAETSQVRVEDIGADTSNGVDAIPKREMLRSSPIIDALDNENSTIGDGESTKQRADDTNNNGFADLQRICSSIQDSVDLAENVSRDELDEVEESPETRFNESVEIIDTSPRKSSRKTVQRLLVKTPPRRSKPSRYEIRRARPSSGPGYGISGKRPKRLGFIRTFLHGMLRTNPC